MSCLGAGCTEGGSSLPLSWLALCSHAHAPPTHHTHLPGPPPLHAHCSVTYNLCLGKEFTGATLTFCGALGAGDHRAQSLVYSHERGRCVVHRGRQRHGADAITSGHRRNLIVWLRNAAFRSNPCMRQGAVWAREGRVDPVCTSYTHDKDVLQHRQGQAAGQGGGGQPSSSAWCPHPVGSPFVL